MSVARQYFSTFILLAYFCMLHGYRIISPKFFKEGCTLHAKKFDANDVVNIKARKPLGVGFVENEENKKRGIRIDEIEKDGSIAKDGRAKKGMYLISVNGKDVRYEDFDTIMDELVELPINSDITLEFIDFNKVFRGPAVIKVIDEEKKSAVTINTVKGLNLRSVLLGSGIEIYDGSAKFTNCGGGLSCATCVVEIHENDGWENRADFESRKLRRYNQQARLSCNTIVEGDCTIILKPKRVS